MTKQEKEKLKEIIASMEITKNECLKHYDNVANEITSNYFLGGYIKINYFLEKIKKEFKID